MQGIVQEKRVIGFDEMPKLSHECFTFTMSDIYGFSTFHNVVDHGNCKFHTRVTVPVGLN